MTFTDLSRTQLPLTGEAGLTAPHEAGLEARQ
jgi:hypothetical protein